MAWWNRSDHYMSTLMDYVEAMYLGSGLAPADLDTSAEVAAIAGEFASLRKATVTLTDAQIKALPTTGIELVQAPGDLKLINPISMVLHLADWTADYSNIHASSIISAVLGSAGAVFLPIRELVVSGVSSLLAGGGPDGTVAFSMLKFNAIAGGTYSQTGFAALTGPYESDVVNQALSLTCNNQGSGNFTDGNAAQSLRVTTYYTIVDVP